MEKNKTDKTKIIEDLQQRLNWLISEATEDEYNEEEVKAIKNLLQIMAPQEPNDLDESYYNPEMAFERFKATLDIRMRIQDEMRRFLSGEVTLADYPDDEDEMPDNDAEDDSINRDCDDLGRDNIGVHGKVLEGKKSAEDKVAKVKTKAFFCNRGMYRGIIAAALVLALFVGGTVGAYAQKNGFFQWVKRDKDGMSVMTSPEGMSNSTESSKRYTTLNEVPEEYRKYIWEPEQVPQGMKFVHYDIAKTKDWDRFMCYYYDNEQNARLEFISRIFAQGVEYYSHQFDSFEFMYSKEYNGTLLEYFKQDGEGDVEYAVSFLHDKVQYIVRGCLPLEEIEKIASEYCKDIAFNLK